MWLAPAATMVYRREAGWSEHSSKDGLKPPDGKVRQRGMRPGGR